MFDAGWRGRTAEGWGERGDIVKAVGSEKAHLWECSERIRAGQGCACQSCGERRFVDHDSTVTRLWPARARLCF